MLKSLLFALCLTFSLAAEDTVVLLLRHAEKAHQGDRAELSRVGHRRAATLPSEFAAFRPMALFASNLVRTQQTLAPLAKALALPLQIYPRGDERALGRRLVNDFRGRTVLVCGHSDTLGELVAALGDPTPFPEVAGYDRYWILRVADGTGTVTLKECALPPVPAQGADAGRPSVPTL